jgi:hypothetical protein
MKCATGVARLLHYITSTCALGVAFARLIQEREKIEKREEKRREREERGREERRREEREGKRRKKKEEKEKKEERMCWTRSSAEIILDFAIEGKYCMICIQNII